jgi:prepilin-type processing-associated H-X9-DG protein/prepilin-type N-terminal cleavage/methylation domain-containing protein
MGTMSSLRKTSLGFSLIELLVVISVLSALMGILLPSLASARSYAKTATCGSNLRQWGLASREYSHEFNNFIPGRGQGQQPMDGVSSLSNIYNSLYWYNTLPPMVGQPTYAAMFDADNVARPGKGSKFWICPEAVDDYPSNKVFFAYGQNMDLSPTANVRPDRLPEIGPEFSMVLMGDSASRYCSIWPTEAALPKAYNPVTRHQNKVNLLFIDGHVAPYAQGTAPITLNPMTSQNAGDEVRWKTPKNTWGGPTL